MKEKIKETIAILETIPTISEQVDALETAIKSLEAWNDVLCDLDHAQDITPMRYGFSGGVQTSREIIEKHL